MTRRDVLASRLKQVAPALLEYLVSQPKTNMRDQLTEFVEVWNWRAVGVWIVERKRADVNALRAQMNSIETQIRQLVSELAACRAWRHAVSPERITGQARADLELYVALVRQLGKGTGIYAAQRRADIRKAMDRCRPSVPVWVMPIYRIAEQLRISPNLFDVVIVDEASQAGVEATFLQYLAPSIVVIGDDKQVSPAGVGINQQELRDLANQFLHDDRYKPSWESPLTSLFDQGKMRFEGLITLVEHRRCVPEIIGFSNRIAYEPEGIRLIPVRQYGADRLDPIKPVYLDTGYSRGTHTRTNPVEAEAIVECIEKCIADPRYDGMTMGVISLLGQPQAKLIEKLLLERVAPEEWSARELRCGDSADFQGSERNVMFLSMVVAPEPDRRLVALTQEMYVQRFNVAASRAQDQMWVFHSVDLGELTNPEDLRRQLLEYCYGVVNRSTVVDAQFENPVPEDVRVLPFDSLFEQRVFNRIIERGFTVIPQFEVEGYRIDLVVVGAGTKVAVECDGDHWHGPERYEADLARMRDLQRCDWTFFNIRESQFYVDRSGSLEPLWEMLDALGVRPSNWSPPEAPGFTEPSTSAPAFISLLPPAPEGSMPAMASTTMGGPTGAAPQDEAVTILDSIPAEFPKSRGSSFHLDSDALGEATDNPEGERIDSTSLEQTSWPRRTPSVELPHRTLLLTPYEIFRGQCTPTDSASERTLIEELIGIIEVEGPITGSRLQRAHVQAAGGQKVGRQIAHKLNSAVTTARRRRLLVADNPLGDQGVKPLTLRLESQPEYIVRELGPRDLEDVPPLELAALMLRLAGRHGFADHESLFRSVLGAYGRKRLTPSVISTLTRVVPLAKDLANRGL